MKPNVPWSVKGIDKDARETAKAAAQREGMTVGEWLNQTIYTAGDPDAAVTTGEIEGLKARDLASAIEHLSRRMAGADAKSADAIDSLARSLGGAVERLQRMERARNPDDAAPGVLQRLESLEAKAGDRTRIDALRALEKAVSQVAQQFGAAQASSLARLDSVERSLQSIATRLEAPAAAAISADTVRQAFDQMAARIERAERVADEAARLKAEAGASTDADFVQKTGLRLRILGDEIKRGGDQIRTLEGTIGRLGQQIDAAEKRSADGIQKVAETINDLRAEVASGDAADQAAARADIEAAVSEITQRTEDRIGALQRSFDEMVRKLEGATRQSVAPPSPADPSPGLASSAALLAAREPALVAQDAARDELDEEFDAAFADLDDAVSTPADARAGLDFALDDDDAAASPPRSDEAYDSDTHDVLAEIREAFGIDPPSPRQAPDDNADNSDDDDLDFDLPAASERDDAPPVIAARGRPEPTDARAGLRADLASGDHAGATGSAGADFLKSARQAARDAAARAAADVDAGGKRKLTPKQRAILAARAKRRRLEEDARDREGVAHAAAPLIAEPPADTAPDAGSSSVKARISAAVAKLKANRTAAPEARAASGKREPTLDEADAIEALAPAAPNIAGGAAKALAKFRAMPMSGGVIGLGAGILLLGVALFVLTKDLGAPKSPRTSDAEPAVAAAAPAAAPINAGPAPAVRDAPEPDDLVRPRDLYLQNIATLKSSESEAEAKAALTEIEKAAALGHPPAQLQLGELYKIGQIYEKDLASARQWFERAANGGNVLAMHRLGVMAARGEGGTVDPAASIGWFEKASAFGLLDSQYNLGATYHPTADGTAAGIQNAALAYYWYAVAARNGDGQAAELAAGLAATLSPAERAAKDAEVAAWTAQTPDPIANELAPAS